MCGIVAYTFLNIYEKIHQFLLSIKRCTQKKIGSFLLPHDVVTETALFGLALLCPFCRLNWSRCFLDVRLSVCVYMQRPGRAIPDCLAVDSNY